MIIISVLELDRFFYDVCSYNIYFEYSFKYLFVFAMCIIVVRFKLIAILKYLNYYYSCDTLLEI